MNNRRTVAGYKLREYIDAIKELRAMDESQWLDNWIRYGQDTPYTPKSVFLSYLEACALFEAENFLHRKAA